MPNTAIKVSHLTKSFEIKKGETVGIIGQVYDQYDKIKNFD